MPAISGHNGRVLVYPQNRDANQGDEDYAGTVPVALMANRWQFSYKTELLETTSYENPRAPLVTPLSSRVAGLTDIDFSFDAYWDTVSKYAHPLGWPDLRPGSRPAIALEIKKGLNKATGFPHISPPSSGLEDALQPEGKLGDVNPIGQFFYFVALITECQISTEVKGVVTYSVSGKATPYVTNTTGGLHELRTGTYLPGYNNGGMPFSSQDYFYQDVVTD
jgi:hypothetical protein